METVNQRFNDPATARSYIRNLADQFEESEEMLEFLSACDMAQAALAYWLCEEQRYYFILRTHYLKGVISGRESRIELMIAWNEYNHAAAEFQLAKIKLKEIISKLYMAVGDRALEKRSALSL